MMRFEITNKDGKGRVPKKGEKYLFLPYPGGGGWSARLMINHTVFLGS